MSDSLPWYLKVNNIDLVWSLTYRGRGVSVIIYDTCVDEKHHGFGTRVTKENECIPGGDWKNTVHGTAVASCITAEPGNYKMNRDEKKQIYVAGIIPLSQVLAISDFRDIAATENRTFPKNRLKELLLNACKLDHEANCRNYEIKDNLQNMVLSFSKEISAPVANRILKYVCDTASNTLMTIGLGNTQADVNKEGLLLLGGLTPKAECDDSIIRVAGTAVYSETDKAESMPQGPGYPNIDYSIDKPTIYGPATDINVFVPGSNAIIDSGTSFATPIVASTISFMMKCNPTASKSLIKHQLIINSIISENFKAPVLQIDNIIEKFCTGADTISFDDL